MYNLAKLFTIALFIFGMFGMAAVLTQETLAIETTELVNLNDDIRAQDLEASEPWLLPDSPFYFLKDWGRAIQSVFTFSLVKKAELRLNFIDERLLELRKLIEQKKNSQEIEKGIKNYEDEINGIKVIAEKIKQRAENKERVGKFLDKFIKHQILQQRILQKLETQVPSGVYDKIREAREKHLEGFAKVMTRLENRENIQERLEKSLREIKESKFKNFNNLGVLIGLEDKVPEEAKEAIRKAQENTLKKIQEDLEKMSPEDQQRFKEYLNKIPEEKKLEYCPDAWEPVCGKDGKTYGNNCLAEITGVKIDYEGACEELPSGKDELFYCETDRDCACGVKIDTKECFFGNRKYIDTSIECPDFCSGFGGNLVIRCIKNKCQQVFISL